MSEAEGKSWDRFHESIFELRKILKERGYKFYVKFEVREKKRRATVPNPQVESGK